MRLSVRTVFVVASLLTSVGLASAQPADPIAAGYQKLYKGDPEDALRHFEALHTQKPDQLPAWFGALLTGFVRLQSDDSDEAAFERRLDALLAAADVRYGRNRADAEALFYLAHASMLRAAFRLTEDKGVWGAARDAARAKGYAEQYVRQHPEHADAYLPLGIYNYFVGIAPTVAKVLRVLLFLPGGNRTEGLAQLERAGREGGLFAPLAQGLVANLYGMFEGRLPDAIAIGERLIGRYPGNAMARIALAQLYAHPTVEAYARAIEQYRAVIERASSSSLVRVSERHAAILGLAAVERNRWRLDEALVLLQPAIDRPVDKPAWIVPTFLLQRANYRMLLNDRAAAEDARRVLTNPRMAKFHKEARSDARTIDRWFQRQSDAAAYASLIPGNRLVSEERFDEARASYERARTGADAEWQVRYRLAVLEFTRRDYGRAAAALEAIVASTARMPDWLKASALLHLAWTRDLAGRRADAVVLYKRIVADFDDETAARPARVGLLAPYRGPVKAQHGAPGVR
jgi:hypothetical protein